MKHLWMICLGATFICHASELQKHPEDVRLVVETLLNLYDEKGIKPRDNELTEAIRSYRESTKVTILLRLSREGQEIQLQTPEAEGGIFELPTRKNAPTTWNLERNFKKALEDKYTVTDAPSDEGISCCTSDCTFIYKLKRKE